jgi:hypothetical protein
MVSRQAATGFSGLGTLKADAIAEAKAFCHNRSLEFRVLNTAESKPPYLAGNFPRAEVNFMCLRAGDPELSRPKLQQQPDVVVESSSAEPAPVARLVSVSIESTPEGADVYVDGSFAGNTPLPSFALNAGQHELEISSLGYAKWHRTLMIRLDAPTRVSALLEAK